MALGSNQKMQLLKDAPLFAHCSKQELQRIASIADQLDVREGKVLIQEGERGREFFVIVEGEVDVQRKGKKVNTLGAGDFFGEIALIAHTPRTATVTSTTPVRLLVITGQSFKTLLEHQPPIAAKVLSALAERLAPASI